MKKILALALLWPIALFGAGNDVRISQKNPQDSAWVDRILTAPITGERLFWFNQTTDRPDYLVLGAGFDVSSGVLNYTESGAGSVLSFSAGNMPPLFTTSVANATTTPALSFSLTSQSANTFFAGPSTGSAAAPTFRVLADADIPAAIARDSELAGYQPLSSELSAIAALTGTTFGRSLLTQANAAEVRTLISAQQLDSNLTALAEGGISGIWTKIGGGGSPRTLTGTANQVTVTNGDGVSGNPTLALPQDIHTAATPTFAGGTLTGSLTIDRGSGATASLINAAATSLFLADARLVEAQAWANTPYTVLARRAEGTRASPTATAADAAIYAVNAYGYGTGYTTGNAARYAISADGLWSGTNNGAYHGWVGTPNGSTTAVEWMRLQGGDLILNNNQAYRVKDTGGTARSVIQLDSANKVAIGAFGVSGSNTSIHAGGAADALQVQATTGNVGIGGSPANKLDVISTGDDQPNVVVRNANAGTNSAAIFRAQSDSGNGLTLVAHALSRTVNRWGFPLGGWHEIFAQSGGSGLVIGTQASVPLVFGTANAERVRIDGSGNVGIGGTPSFRLHSFSDGIYNTDTGHPLVLSSATTPARRLHLGYDNTNDLGYLQATQSGVGVKNLVLQGAGGNVGIGGAPGGGHLHIIGTGEGTTRPQIRLSNTETAATQKFARVVASQYDSVAEPEGFTLLSSMATAAGNVLNLGGFLGENNAATQISFYTATTVDTRAGTERMRLDGTGSLSAWGSSGVTNFLKVGSSSVSGQKYVGAQNSVSDIQVGVFATGEAYMGNNFAYPFQFYTNGGVRMILSAAGALRLNNYGAGTLTTDSSGNVTATSDGRMKDVTGTFDRGLDAIKHLTPKVYKWKPESGLNTDDINVGFIAQDVLPFIPEAVATVRTKTVDAVDSKTKEKTTKQVRDDAEVYSFSDRPVIAALVNAAKELAAKVETLEAENATLKAQMADVLARLAALEKKPKK